MKPVNVSHATFYASTNNFERRSCEWLEQERSDPPSQAPSLAELVKTNSSAPNEVDNPSSPSSAERIE